MISIVDIFDKKRTDITLASGTLKEMQYLAAKLNPSHLQIACISEDRNAYELFVKINVSFEIKVNNQEVISSETLADLRLKDCN